MRTWFAVTWSMLLLVFGCAGTVRDAHLSPAAVGVSRSQAGEAGAAEAPRVDAARRRVFLWKTQSATATVYLLGSIHVGTPDVYPLDVRIEQAFERSDTLVLETNVDDSEMADQMAAIVERALLPPGESLFARLDPELVTRLHAKLTSLGLDPARFDGFELWFLSLVMSSAELEQAGYSGEFGIDAYFRRRSEGKMPIVALEAVEDQIELLLEMSGTAQEEDIRRALEEDQTEFLGRMFEDWAVGDVQALEREMAEMRRDYPEAFDNLFTRRNRTMAEGVLGYLGKQGTYFVVVGAGHLVGPGCVIELLRARGFHVVQQ
jgi:hypothetical protein